MERKAYILFIAIFLCFLFSSAIAPRAYGGDEFPIRLGRENIFREDIFPYQQNPKWQPIFEADVCPSDWCNLKLKIEHNYSNLPRASVVREITDKEGTQKEERLFRFRAEKRHGIMIKIEIQF